MLENIYEVLIFKSVLQNQSFTERYDIYTIKIVAEVK